MRLRTAEAKRIDVIALAAASRTDVDALHAKLTETGAKIIGPPQDLASPGGGYQCRQ